MFNRPEWKWLTLGVWMVFGGFSNLSAQTAKKADSKPAAKAAAKPANPETLLEPFDPPPLSELDAQAKWQKQPVLDAFDLLKAKLAKEKPLATVAEALKLMSVRYDFAKRTAPSRFNCPAPCSSIL